MQRTFTEDLRHQFKTGSIYTKLIILNTAVFLVMIFISIFLHLNNYPRPIAIASMLDWFAPSGNMQHNLTHPWSIFLYMFLHIDAFHFIMQMFLLYFTGRIFIEYLDEKKLLNTYIFGGISGLLFYIIAMNVFPVFNGFENSPLLGASAATLALLVAVSFHLPQTEIMLFGAIRIKLIYIALLFIAIDLIAIPNDNRGARIAHLGGTFYGILAAGFYRKPKFVLNTFDLTTLFSPERWFKKKSRMKVEYSKRPISDIEYNENKVAKQKRIDTLLEKINRSGYESLTKEEKDFLFKASKDV